MSMPAPKRQMRPREPIATSPLAISQLTSLQHAGIDGRRFLELVRARGIRSTKVGKLVVVEADVLRAALREGGVVRDSEPTPQTEVDDDSEDAPVTADEVLARIGHKRRIT